MKIEVNTVITLDDEEIKEAIRNYVHEHRDYELPNEWGEYIDVNVSFVERNGGSNLSAIVSFKTEED